MARRDKKSVGYAACAATAREEVGASPLGRLAKRIFDVVTATICLTLFSPILLIASIAIKLDSRGPILIRATLYGYKNRTIQVHQFRVVMVCAAGEQIDPPLTPVGQILRQTSIEELPRLFNVLSGEMSIIGRRPCAQPSALLNRDKPGMTGWAQIFGFQNLDRC